MPHSFRCWNGSTITRFNKITSFHGTAMGKAQPPGIHPPSDQHLAEEGRTVLWRACRWEAIIPLLYQDIK